MELKPRRIRSPDPGEDAAALAAEGDAVEGDVRRRQGGQVIGVDGEAEGRVSGDFAAGDAQPIERASEEDASTPLALLSRTHWAILMLWNDAPGASRTTPGPALPTHAR